MALLLKLLLILVLALLLPVIGLLVLGQAWWLGLALLSAPMVIAYHLV